MTQIIQDQSDIPEARFYVVARDTFMSGWGHAEGKDNYLILPCKDHTEALVVQDNAQARSEMDNITITDSKPPMRNPPKNGKPILWQVMSRYHATRWYTVGGFR